MRIIVDADACPVKDIIIQEAKEKHLPVILVSSISHHSTVELPNHVETIYVDSGSDAADYKIIQIAKDGDIVITQDYGLASLLLPKGCTVIHHNGFQYTNDNIDEMLHRRHVSSAIRRSGGRTKGPKPFTEEDRMKFTHKFIKHI